MAEQVFTKIVLSGGTSGKDIKVGATATPGTLIHTAHATALDEINLDVCNTDSSARLLTIEWGGVTAPDNTMEISIPADSGWIPIVVGHLLTGGLVVRAFAAAGNVLLINGAVNRIT